MFCLAFLGGGTGGCGGTGGSGGGSGGGGSSANLGINDFAYQLEAGGDEIDIAAIGETAFDLVVIDYSRDGSGGGEFTAAEIDTLKTSSGGSKIVLAYMSIGEAEDYRYYFDTSWIDGSGGLTGSAPDYLAPQNPEWPGNYKVRYWDPEWQAILFGTASGANKSYLDRIIDAGFDGVYLDIIDAYEFFGPDGEMEERPTAAADMIDLVLAIARYARETRGVTDFLVFPQNGAAILDEEGGDDYLNAVDGIGAEDTFYSGDEDNDNDLDLDWAGEVTPYLDRFVAAGKTVLATDYVQDPAKVADFYSRCREKGYIPYATVRDLNRIVINAGFEPD